MRFQRLSLERYGHFDGCNLDFPDQKPDIHIIRGGNEAGKSTSRIAVGDLLFGFPTRSPYNFRFDYPMLRIGAVLEDGGKTIAFRRRKSGASTLIDANDNAFPESELLAMLRGQTRDVFQLSFSLDQDALRSGGRAMVAAKDDVGQALFAAGSGLIGLSEELKRLEEEAEAIWGRRARQGRAYTKAERELEAATKVIRDASLKPKSWKDARDAQEDARKILEAIEKERAELQVESRKTERTRRVAGNVRLRQTLLQQINASTDIEATPAVETAILAALEAADAAARARALAERLLKEVEERIQAQSADPVALDEAEVIDGLIEASGAVTKALRDLTQLQPDRDVAVRELQSLRTRTGSAGDITLSADTVAGLRQLANAHAADAAALEQIEKQRDALEERRGRLEAKLAVGGEELDQSALVDAVDAARKLGADVDERCVTAKRSFHRASTSLQAAIARLTPWTGTVEDLDGVSAPSTAEIHRAKDAQDREAEIIAAEEAAARRLDGEAKRLGLDIKTVGTGAAISQQALENSRGTRDAQWLPLRDHLLGAGVLEDVGAQASSYETSVTSADDVADRRFALAEASARLATLEANRAQRQAEADQSRRAGQAARERLDALKDEWTVHLRSIGLPELDPVQLEAWLVRRDQALLDQAELLKAQDDLSRIEERRASALQALRQAMGEAAAGPVEIAAVLIRAERARSEAEGRKEQRKRDQESLDQTKEDIAVQDRRRASIAAKSSPRSASWDKLLSGTGVVLDIETAVSRISTFDDLRKANEDLRRLEERIGGITRDAERFQEEVRAVAIRLGMDAGLPSGEAVKQLRGRLENARATSQVLREHENERARRQKEIAKSAAEYAVATDELTPLREEAGWPDTTDLYAAIEASRGLREKRVALARAEEAIIRDGDGMSLDDLAAMVMESDPDTLTAKSEAIDRQLAELDARVSAAAAAHGEASRTFTEIEKATTTAPDAAFDAEQARAEMAVQAETYILRRAQALTLRWAIERYRERNQNPMVARASQIFAALTLGRYSGLQIDIGETSPRLLGITGDGRKAIEVDAMSEGTTDQLFLSLRLAAIEHTVDTGIRLPFIADDLFVNFDDDRARAGFQVLADLATKTQVLFFTHHSHLADIARSVVGNDVYSECRLAV